MEKNPRSKFENKIYLNKLVPGKEKSQKKKKRLKASLLAEKKSPNTAMPSEKNKKKSKRIKSKIRKTINVLNTLSRIKYYIARFPRN